MKQLDHAWRLFGTGFSFAVFGLGGMIMGLLLFPMLFVFIRNTRNRQIVARKMIGGAFRAFIWLMKSLGVFSFQIEGAEHIVPGRNQLIIANHPTLIDVVFLVSLFPQTDCVIKEAVTKNLFMRSTVAAANYISNSDPQDLLTACIARLGLGGSLLLFPEGTRSSQAPPLHFKHGAAAVAASSGVQILPIIVRCMPPTLGKNEPWFKIPPARPCLSVQILEPASVQELVPGERTTRQVRRALNESLEKIFNSRLS